MKHTSYATPFLPVNRDVKRRTFKAVNIVVQLAVILSLGFQGGFGAFVPQAAQAANPAANLDQCRNGTVASPAPCTDHAGNTGWENGNAGQSNSHWFEGDSIAYRLKFTDLAIGAHTVTFEWDTTQGGLHAIDYLTTFNRTETTADPCSGISGCGSSSTFPIPVDPNVTAGGVTPIAGSFTLYNGTITNASAYTPSGSYAGNSQTKITLTFTTTVANPVLAWGGHIATRADWGPENSAVAISGSPYHTRLLDLDGSGGNQDRSLSSDAVIFPASITVIKQATPEGSQSFGYTSTGGLSSFSLVDDGTTANTQTFSNITNFTTYTVTESALAGWTLSFNNPVCSVTSSNGGSQSASSNTLTVNLNEGENVTCAFNNVRQAATVTVIKNVVNDNGGTKVAGDFTMHVTGANPSSSTFAGSATGTVVTVDPGVQYSVTEDAVTGYTGSSSTDCTGTVAAGQNKTCTVTNNDVQPKLTVTKVVVNNNGGTGVVSDFPLFVGATGVTSGVQNGFNAGAYVVSETSQSGYTGTIAGDCAGNGSITLVVGDVKSCTITNDDQAASLTVIKHVVNDNGGTKEASDFTLNVTGGNASPASFPGNENGTGVSLDAGSYSVSEDAVNGYAVSYSADCSGSLAPGEHKTCTVTNNDIQPKLTVTKVVVNDNGGTKEVTDFPLFVDQTGVTSGVQNGFNAGAHVVSETNVSGYTATITGDCDANGNITLTAGQTASCTITNNDSAPSLHLRKIVVNNNGGTALGTDWTLSATGPTSLSGSTPVDSGASFDAGTYTLSETGPNGYAASAWTCVGGSQNGNSISLSLGESATCTITNDDIAPSLTLVKAVENGNGGTAVATDWTLTASGPTPISGAGGAASGAGFAAGTYTLSENAGPSGYAPSAWVCIGGSQNGDQITLGLNESATCTITNNDVQPTLTLIKEVTVDDGGTATPTSFVLHYSDGVTTTDTSSGYVNFVSANVDYTVSETDLPGYSAGTWTGACSPDGHVTLQPGQNATCTITNDDVAPTLRLVKALTQNNGGNETAGQWELTAAGDQGFSDTGDSTTFHAVKANEAYTLSEDGPAGYTPSGWVCNGGSLQGNVLTLDLGTDVTCTITNDDVAPTITLIKDVDNLNNAGRTAGANDFNLTVGGVGVNSGDTLAVDANTSYALNETVLPGYAFVSITGDEACPQVLNGTVTLSEGANVTCTIHNVATLPEFTLTKVGTPDPVEAGSNVTWNITWGVTGSIATNVTITDEIPANTIFVSADNGGTYDSGSNTVTWNLGSHDAGDSGSVTLITHVVSPLANGTVITNVAKLTSLETAPSTVNAEDSVTVHSAPTLTIDKTDSPDPVAAGANLTYTLAWTIGGNALATNVVITDPLPANTTFVSADNGGTYDSGSNTVTWNLGTQTPPALGSVSLVVKVASPIANGTVLSNTGTICGVNSGAEQGDVSSPTLCATDTETTTVASAPILTITKVNDVTTFVNPGATVNYTVTVTNTTGATDTAHNVSVTDVLPAGFTFVSGGTSTKTFVLGELAPGASITTSYAATVSTTQTAGIYTNTATASATNAPAVSASSNVDVRVPEVLAAIAIATLAITKTADVPFAGPDTTVTYTITVKNIGEATAVNVVLHDTLPAGFTYVIGGGQEKTWNLGNLEPGTSRVINYQVRLSSHLKAGKYTNVADARADNASKVSARLTLPVKVGQVLGLATTGAGRTDLLIALSGALLILFGALGLRRSRRENA
jgi:uncharacterized repeat protein (TIGR01451 family)